MTLRHLIDMLVSLLLAAATPPVIITPNIPMDEREPVPQLIDWQPGLPSCGGEVPAIVHRERPMPSAHLRYPQALPSAQGMPAILRFRIDATGRPLGIAGEAGREVPGSDLAPALAAWRFAAARPRERCTITFTPREVPVAEAELETVYRFVALVNPRQPDFNRAVGRAAFERAHPAGSSCRENRPAPRMLAYPAFDRIQQAPGTVSYSFFSFDIDGAGAPTGLRLLSSAGNVALDRESADAIRRSRFAPGERRGCIIFFNKRSVEPLRPRPPPEEDALAPAGATCPNDGRSPWAQLPRLVFPEEFLRRGIEGWAIVRYDLAPWGGVGNVEAVEAQPAASFGERALGIVRGGRKQASPSGYSGCVTRVIFKLPEDGRQSSPDP